MQILNKRELYEHVYQVQGDVLDQYMEKAIEDENIEDEEADLEGEGRFFWGFSQQSNGNMGMAIEDLDKLKDCLLEAKKMNPNACIRMEEVDIAGSYNYLIIFVDIDCVCPYFFTVSFTWK